MKKVFLFYFISCFSVVFSRPLTLDALEAEVKELQESVFETRYQMDLEERAVSPDMCSGRLTLVTGVPVPTTSTASSSIVYYTPYKGSKIALFDGTRWNIKSFSQVSITLAALTSDKNYDVFGYNNSGTLALELSDAWTSDTVRLNALGTQDGITVKNLDKTRRYLGTIRTISTSTTADSPTQRFVWNYYNKTQRIGYVNDATASWSSLGGAFARYNASTANRVEYVAGIADYTLRAHLVATAHSTSTDTNLADTGGIATTSIGLGVDSTTTNSTFIYGGVRGYNANRMPITGMYSGAPATAIGYHALNVLQYGDRDTGVIYGKSTEIIVSGLMVFIDN